MDPPVPLVEFDNGKLISKPCDMPVQLFQSKNETQERIVAVEVGSNEYVGQNKRRKVDQLCKFYIAVKHKDSSVSFHEAEKFNLQRHSTDNRVFEDITLLSSSSFRQQSDQLTSAYGSSKKQKAMRSRQLNKIEGEALDSAMNISVNIGRPSTLDASVLSDDKTVAPVDYLPPYNADASCPEDVYKLHDIISRMEYEAMKSCVDELLTATNEQVLEWQNEAKYGYFIINHIPVLQDLEEEKQLDMAIKLKYLHYLLNLYTMNANQIRKPNLPFPQDMPPSVKNNLLNTFTQVTAQASGRQVRSRSSKSKDKLLINILILAMIIDNYKLQIQELMIDVKMSRPSLTKYLRNIGAQVKKSSMSVFQGEKLDTYTAEISIPLSFPDFNKPKRTYKSRK